MSDIAHTGTSSLAVAVNSHPSPTTCSSGAELGKIPRILQRLLLDTGWPESVVRLLWRYWQHSPKHQGLVQALRPLAASEARLCPLGDSMARLGHGSRPGPS